MDHIQAPALLAYRGGEVFTTITDIIRNIPKGRSCSADSLEDLLKLYVVNLEAQKLPHDLHTNI
jgi:hypothetical protein